MTATRSARAARQALVVCGLAGGALAQDAPALPDRAEIEVLLRSLDQSFAAGDVDGYLARFEPDHPGAVAMFGEHLRQLVDMAAARSRTSQVVAGPRAFGDRVVVRVRHTMRWDGTRWDGVQPLVEDAYLAVARGEAGGAVPTFAVEVPATRSCVAGDRFRCPACNYEIGGVDGWLCVPLRPDRARALESANFYLIGTDVACDVSVQVVGEPVPARTVAQRLVTALAQLEPSAEPGVATDWLPPSLADDPPPGLDAARAEVRLPQEGDGGSRLTFHVVTFGGLQHLLLLRGGVATQRREQARVEALLQSYRLLEPNCDRAAQSTSALEHHTRGALDGSVYRNAQFGVEFAGPEGWHAEQRAGGAAFCVRWSRANGSAIWLLGYGVPSGLSAWTRACADRWLDDQLATRALESGPADTAADAPPGQDGWCPEPDGAASRSLVLRPRERTDPAAPGRRLFRVHVYDDLLVVVDGHGATADDEHAVRAAIRSLRRR